MERANNLNVYTKIVAYGKINIKTLDFAILKLDARDCNFVDTEMLI